MRSALAVDRVFIVLVRIDMLCEHREAEPGSKHCSVAVSLQLGHLQGKTVINCFLTLSGRFATRRKPCKTEQIPVAGAKKPTVYAAGFCVCN